MKHLSATVRSSLYCLDIFGYRKCQNSHKIVTESINLSYNIALMELSNPLLFTGLGWEQRQRRILLKEHNDVISVPHLHH